MGSSRKKSKKSHKNKKKSRCSSSSSSISSNEEWVEAKSTTNLESPKEQDFKIKPIENPEQRDEWMSFEVDFPCVTRDQLKKKKQTDEDESKYMLDRSSISSNEEWVEAKSTTNLEFPKEQDFKIKPIENPEQRDEWMSFEVDFPCVTRDQLKKKKQTDEDESKYMLDRMGQTDRELNPYWKNGGSGLPEQVKDLEVSKNAVGDYGVEWLKKALRRAKEQAAEDGRRLEDVVAERWGSLEKLQSMIKEAETRSDKRNNKYEDKISRYNVSKTLYSSNSKKYDSKYKDKKFMKPLDDDYYDKKGAHKRKSSDDESPDRRKSKRKYFKKHDSDYHNDSIDYRSRDKKSSKFIKPSEDDGYRTSSSGYDKTQKDLSHYSSSSNSRGGWRKNRPDTAQSTSASDTNVSHKDIVKTSSTPIQSEVNDIKTAPQVEYLTSDERNELAAKLIKAEIMGNTELAKKLKDRLDTARAVATESDNTVILTRTDSKGFTQPLSLPSKPEFGRGKKQKIQTHEAGKRIRYFADDDKYSLQEMFQREKRSTVEDQNEMFAKLASKNIGRDESCHDMDDVFEDMVRVKESAGKLAAKERDRAIEQHKRSSAAVDNCQWCFDGKRLLKHLIITIGKKVLLCLPPYESLTTGHCLLIPIQHVRCGTQLDEDVWEELQVFRKLIVKMFLEDDLDVIFFESAMNFSHMPHMVLQCVPLPKESGDLAPIYFKKAILECEIEWSTNKKLVDLAGKDIRSAIPKGLPYFAVDFGLQSGFAHVIEDEKIFPKNFAQEIIGGMLDVDHRMWRKPKFQNFEEQRKKTIEFSKMWQPFNCFKNENDEK